MSAVVDMRNFQSAFKAYLGKTSKTMEEAVNWKAADLMLTAAKHTPKTKLTAAAFKRMQSNPRLISYRTGRRFGDASGKGWTRPEWNATRDAMQLRSLGKGFMRSAFIKAATKIPRTKKGKRAGLSESEMLTKSRANVQIATGTIKQIAAQLLWEATDGRDATRKQRIVDTALEKAVPEVTASMLAYLRGENARNARSVSS